MSRIPDEVLEAIRDRVDIVAFIGRSVELKKAGRVYKGRCPFHSERSASFTVTAARRTYHCFGCSKHGDVVRFVIEHTGASFRDAVVQLAAEAHVEIPDDRRETPAERQAREHAQVERVRLLAVQDQLAALYTETLYGPEGAAARAYLGTERGVKRAICSDYRLGWAVGDPGRLAAWAGARGIASADLVALGVVVEPEDGPRAGAAFDGGRCRFRDRVMFPVVDLAGEVLGFGGRVIDAGAKVAKYINSPETPVYTKGDQLYGVHQAHRAARQAGQVLVFEGNLDVVVTAQAGVRNVVAAMGTALTERQVRLLRRLADAVVLVMDGDSAGRAAAFKHLDPLLAGGLRPRVVWLPDGEDPDSFVRRHGVEALRELVGSAGALVDAYVDHVAATHAPDTAGRTEAVKALVPVLARAEPGIERSVLRRAMATAIGVPEGLFDLDAPAEAGPAPEVRTTAPPWAGQRRAPASRAPRRPGSTAAAEARAVALLLAHPLLAVGLDVRLDTWATPPLAVVAGAYIGLLRQGATPDAAALMAQLDDGTAATLLDLLAQEPPRTDAAARAAFDSILASSSDSALLFARA